MRVKVLFFGAAHDVTGFGEEHLELAEGLDLAELRRRYEARFPQLREMNGALVAAVNQEVCERSWPLSDGDEVAFLPPVSGGRDGDRSGPERGDFFQLTRQPIPTARLAEELKAAADGAVVVFEGIVRDHLGQRRTLYLEYEAYEAMAIAKMEEIGREARGRFAVDRLGIIHRLGRIEIGETSVAIIVTSEHRRAAFEACHFAIDRLKQVVPIWKKEYFEDGAVWAEGESAPAGRQETGAGRR
ncbi:MAG TPA: molybdenum cofactor biosynthesis protein MoaE [Terriglobia bacterium]|nr:molybdenum cofactor biosynthesis protein MoaE [Terriglobia bacterium]